MRKLTFVAVVASILVLVTLGVPSHTTYQFNPPQTAGDIGPGGG